MTTRWGILGTGGIARTFVADLALTDSGTAVAVGSRSRHAAEEFAGEFDIPNRHDSYQSLVADPEVDVVYIATPHPMHHDNALLALRAGKPILVEKPFTMNAAEAREVVDVARANGLFAMEAMWTRFLPQTARIWDWLTSGVLGEIVTVTADHGQWFAEDPEFRLFAPALGGGALLDLGVYPVSFASMVLGAPNQVIAIGDPTSTGVDAQTSILLRYQDGAQAVLTCTLRAKSPTRAAIVGTEARIEIDGDFYAPSVVTLIPRTGAPIRVEPDRRGRGLFHEADEVARQLAAGALESPLMPLAETVAIMEPWTPCWPSPAAEPRASGRRRAFRVEVPHLAEDAVSVVGSDRGGVDRHAHLAGRPAFGERLRGERGGVVGGGDALNVPMPAQVLAKIVLTDRHRHLESVVAGVGEAEQVELCAGKGHAMQRGTVSGALVTVEAVVQRAVQDGVEPLLDPVERGHVGVREVDLDAVLGGSLPRGLQCRWRTVDSGHLIAALGEQDRVVAQAAPGIEHGFANGTGAGQRHHDRLSLADVPRGHLEGDVGTGDRRPPLVERVEIDIAERESLFLHGEHLPLVAKRS
ncbi:putative dehydrogenase [Herbihabitans rhizosphaerae]|uniref:Putative dehydrogenase n=1 Tax=Herbihabitans rhizosphaerae TaxID=1872711 RepID=A0A4Q7KLE0_9PSEU|nr:putative dehydrogenase [Herbihabitans rhizosphaerae]